MGSHFGQLISGAGHNKRVEGNAVDIVSGGLSPSFPQVFG